MVPHHSHFWTQTYAQGREQPNFARWPNQARKTLTESTIQGIKGPTKKLATANRSRVSIRVINIFDLQACRRRGQQKISSHHHHHHEKSGYCGSTIRCYLWVMRVFHVGPEVEMSGLLPVYPSALPHGISNGFLSMPNLLADGAAISTSVNISTSGTETFRSGIYFRVYGGTSAFPYV